MLGEGALFRLQVFLHGGERLDDALDTLTELGTGEVFVEDGGLLSGTLLADLGNGELVERPTERRGERQRRGKVGYPDAVHQAEAFNTLGQGFRDYDTQFGLGVAHVILELGHPGVRPAFGALGLIKDGAAGASGRADDLLGDIATTHTFADFLNPVGREGGGEAGGEIEFEHLALGLLGALGGLALEHFHLEAQVLDHLLLLDELEAVLLVELLAELLAQGGAFGVELALHLDRERLAFLLQPALLAEQGEFLLLGGLEGGGFLGELRLQILQLHANRVLRLLAGARLGLLETGGELFLDLSVEIHGLLVELFLTGAKFVEFVVEQLLALGDIGGKLLTNTFAERTEDGFAEGELMPAGGASNGDGCLEMHGGIDFRDADRIPAATQNIDFCLNCLHNLLVMFQTGKTLQQWLHRRAPNLDKATLGQLVTLLELVSSESVASMSKGQPTRVAAASAGVNYRQKLARLELALGIGRLTRRVGKVTRPTEAGIRVAGELRLFLDELRAIESRKAPAPTWIVGAGDAWLQSIIVPALTDLSISRPEWRWEVRNLRSQEIRSELRDGVLHFGYVRSAEVTADTQFDQGARTSISSYRAIVGKAQNAPSDAKALVKWAINNNRPMVQQGSTWPALRERISKSLGLLKEMASLEPHVRCETHPQAVVAAQTGGAWCIVPQGLGRAPVPESRNALIDPGPNPDTMVLIHYARALRKHAGADDAWNELCRVIRKTANSDAP